ncbi:hypothetical protein AVEN_42972-1 [Araneus ventricosus]|uniref:Uncharacterized protein n=1 Tax=Araneus ventricosus TaxID=182803 RepID=A0A4Y2AFD0_ARAVE|nr:hypothetical protein AVEN_42972-1 [Araneus ventricosus]
MTGPTFVSGIVACGACNGDYNASVKLAIHDNTALFHLDNRPGCFPPIQVDQFRDYSGKLQNELPTASIPPIPPRLPLPHTGDFRFLKKAHSPSALISPV